MESKHTPGPWRFADIEKDLDDSRLICQVGDQNIFNGDLFNPPDFDQDQANARLIAAAPDMLKALQEIAEGSGAFSSDPLTHAGNCIDKAISLAEAAIAKATAE